MKQLPTLPDQKDRDLFAVRFATILWVFDHTRFLEEPPADKSEWLERVRRSLSTLQLTAEAVTAVMAKLNEESKSEQSGNDSSATAPESKANDSEAPAAE